MKSISLPTGADFHGRVGHNLSYFRNQYFVWALLVFVVLMIYQPAVLCLSILLLVGWYAMFAVKTQPLVVPMMGALSFGQELALVFVGTALVVAFVGVPPILIWALTAALCGILLHASIMKPSTLGGSSGSYNRVAASESDSLISSI